MKIRSDSLETKASCPPVQRGDHRLGGWKLPVLSFYVAREVKKSIVTTEPWKKLIRKPAQVHMETTLRNKRAKVAKKKKKNGT